MLHPAKYCYISTNSSLDGVYSLMDGNMPEHRLSLFLIKATCLNAMKCKFGLDLRGVEPDAFNG